MGDSGVKRLTTPEKKEKKNGLILLAGIWRLPE
jgi:hypothetical protein